LARSHGGYFEALCRACDDAPAEPSWQEQERQRRYDELLARYGQPVGGYLIPREYVEAVKKKEAEADHGPQEL
jgi:hypothetical protein